MVQSPSSCNNNKKYDWCILAFSFKPTRQKPGASSLSFLLYLCYNNANAKCIFPIYQVDCWVKIWLWSSIPHHNEQWENQSHSSSSWSSCSSVWVCLKMRKKRIVTMHTSVSNIICFVFIVVLVTMSMVEANSFAFGFFALQRMQGIETWCLFAISIMYSYM